MSTKIATKAEGLAQLLLEKIVSGEIPPGGAMPSEWALVRKFGVSRTTVRITLANLEAQGLIYRRRGSGTYVREDVIARIREEKEKPVIKVGVVLYSRQSHNSVLLGVLESFAEYAGAKVDVHLMLHNFLKPEYYQREGFDLLLVEGGSFSLRSLLELEPTDQIIFFNKVVPDRNCICTDNHACGRLAVQCLLDAGHRKIGLLHYGEDSIDDFTHRYFGMHEVLRERGIKPAAEVELALRNLPSLPVEMAVDQLLKKCPDLTGIVTVLDHMAINVYDVLEERGLKVPQDISVVGVDDQPVSRYLYPPLTTVRQPVERIGQLLAEAAWGVIGGRRLNLHALVPPLLVERGSVRKIPAEQPAGTEGLQK